MRSKAVRFRVCFSSLSLPDCIASLFRRACLLPDLRGEFSYVSPFLPYAFAAAFAFRTFTDRSEEHTSELQSQSNLVCRLLLEKKKKITPSATGFSHERLSSLN